LLPPTDFIEQERSLLASDAGHWLGAYPTLRYGATVVEAVADKLAQMDQEFGTPNNWESMLQAGIASDLDALGYLGDCIEHPLVAG
jgi:hypothetical protein